jgi:peptidoglycan/LPS O-acetylase OafA/YrhL
MLEFVLGMFGYKFLTRKANAKRQSVVLLLLAVAVWLFLFAQKFIPVFVGVDRLIKYGIPAFVFFLLVFKYFENRTVSLPLVFAGNISYSIYITHIFVIQPFSRIVYDLDTISAGGVVLVFAVVFPLCFAVAFISWYIIENKFTKYLRRKFKI